MKRKLILYFICIIERRMFCKIIDFNADGTKELILAYQNGFWKTDKNQISCRIMGYLMEKYQKNLFVSVSWTENNCEYFADFPLSNLMGITCYLPCLMEQGRK